MGAEFLVVDVGAANIKEGAALTVLAVADDIESAEAKAASVQARSAYVAIVETKKLLLRKPKIELEKLKDTLFERR